MSRCEAQTERPRGRAAEIRLAAKHACVSVLGFLVDAAALRIGLHFGLEPAWARVISLALAMHATFLVNGLYVFRRLRPERRLSRRWAGYMAANAFGNLCNYWIFVTVVSLHLQPVSAPLVALALASLAAWAINYGFTRFVVFGRSIRLISGRLRALLDGRGRLHDRARAGPGSARR